MSGRSWAESDIGLKLNALGIDPMGPADQVQRMREHIVELERDLARAEADAESQRDEVRRLYDKFRRSEYSCRDTEADRRRYIDKAHEACMARDSWREQSDKYKAEVACLKEQLTAAVQGRDAYRQQLHEQQNLNVGLRDVDCWLNRKLRELQAKQPKRQTRAESVADQITKIREASKKLGVLDAMGEARMLCHAAGVNADEEKPEAT